MPASSSAQTRTVSTIWESSVSARTLAPATTIVLTVSPSLNIDGRKEYSTRRQLFDGRAGDRFLVKRSPTPFCAARHGCCWPRVSTRPQSWSCGMRGRPTTRCGRRSAQPRRLPWRIAAPASRSFCPGSICARGTKPQREVDRPCAKRTRPPPGAFLDFGSVGGKDSYSFARKP
jgi:hypothetical protein